MRNEQNSRATIRLGGRSLRFVAMLLGAIGWMSFAAIPSNAQEGEGGGGGGSSLVATKSGFDASQLPGSGPGHDLVAKNCPLCHSLDRVVSVRRTKAAWLGEVQKMWQNQALFSENDIPAMADYLFTNFGRPDLPPRPARAAAPPLPAEYANYDFSKPAVRGILTGAVTSDQGQVKAFSVIAHNLLYRVRYMIYTKDGRYTLPQALPGPYEVSAGEYGFSSQIVKGDLKAGGSATVDLAVTKDPPNADPNTVYFDLDTVYAPGPGRDLYMKNCIGCHQAGSHAKMNLTEYGFRRGIDYMRWGRTNGGGGVPDGPTYFSNTGLSTSDMDTIAHYLGTIFPPDVKRVLKRPDYPTDENVTSKAIFVTYDLPDDEVKARGGNIGFHDSFVASDGTAWYGSGAGGGTLIALNPKEQDPSKRMKFFGGGPDDPKFGVNGIAEDTVRHHVYFASFGEGKLVELDPVSGKISIHITPSHGGMHSLYGDNQGNIWYMNLYGGQVGKYDPTTGHSYPYPSHTPDIGPYGVTGDNKGGIWVAGIAKNLIARYDTETQTMTEFKIPTPGVGVRRIRLDSKGTVYFSEGTGQGIGKYDPQTGQFTNFKLPVPNIAPYDVWVDKKDESVVWGSDLANDYGFSPFSYNTKTKKMVYFPGPPGTWGPQVAHEPNNTVWFVQRAIATRGGSGQTHFYPGGYTADAPPEP